jgi:hypothetical protein
MARIGKQTIHDFYIYPSVGEDDWGYAFETAQVRIYEMSLLSRGLLQDMANADGFSQAVELLSGTEYAVGSTGDFERFESCSRN